jgi:hypothetical protein
LKKLLEGKPINDFKYLCCQKTVFEKGELLCSHKEINSDNILYVDALNQESFDEL